MNIETLVSDSPTVALVTLIARSKEESRSPDKLAAELRRELESSPLSRLWTVDKVTVIDELNKLSERTSPLQRE
jgi:hypothetical protein